MPQPGDPDELRSRVVVDGVMDLTLTNDEVKTLRWWLRDYLPELKFEVARTDAKEILHILVQRRTLCERLLHLLDEAFIQG